MPDSITLKQLHKVIQSSMGWSDRHQHEFIIADTRYGNPELGSREMFPERSLRLGKCLGSLKTFSYVYDFGDFWEFTLQVENVLPLEAVEHFPACIDGARAAPPEDVGGPPGYLDFLEAMANPMHPGHADAIKWYGGKFEPEQFVIPVTSSGHKGALHPERENG